VLTQLRAARAALSRVETEMLRDHLGPLHRGGDHRRRRRRTAPQGRRADRAAGAQRAMSLLKSRRLSRSLTLAAPIPAYAQHEGHVSMIRLSRPSLSATTGTGSADHPARRSTIPSIRLRSTIRRTGA
jgi:hypothetical protein